MTKLALFLLLKLRCNTFLDCNTFGCNIFRARSVVLFLLHRSNLKSAFFSVGDYKNNNLFLVKLGWIFYTRPSNGLWWPRRCLSWPSIASVEKLKGFSWLKTAFGSFSVFKIVQDLHDRDDPQDPKDLEICIRQTERCDSVLGFKNERKRVFSVQNWF